MTWLDTENQIVKEHQLIMKKLEEEKASIEYSEKQVEQITCEAIDDLKHLMNLMDVSFDEIAEGYKEIVDLEIQMKEALAKQKNEVITKEYNEELSYKTKIDKIKGKG
ncbi:MAG: hypothetical protein ACRC17_00870 [Culicoidibacterales bacterium]